MRNALIMALAMSIILCSCHKDSSFTEINESERTGDVVINILTIEGEVSGIVYDEDNQGLVNTTISINGQEQLTDENGTFYFPEAQLNGQGTYITAEKDGYILGSDFIYPGDGLNSSYIQLLKLSQDISFQAEAGGTIQIERGGSIEFNPNSITSAFGETYTGTVNVTAKRLATDDLRLEDKMPGDLLGRNASNQEVVLATLGMVAVELRGENGEELNLMEGSTATINFPITEQDQAFAPEQIPLWYFDEIKGLWVEEGSATKVGNNYVGDVAHFSFWNCDVPYDLITFCVHISNDHGTPADDVNVTICTNGLGSRSGRPQRGELRGKIPKDEILEIKIFGNSECGDLLYQQEIGPFSEDVKLDPIQLDSGNKFTLNGTITCAGEAVSNGQVIIRGDNFIDLVSADENGQFTHSTCSSNILEIYAKNLDTGEGSLTQEVSFTEANPELDVSFVTCTDCSFEVEVAFDNATPCDELVTASLNVSGNGTYTLNWNDGSQGESFSISQGEYSVTVIEAGTECEQVIAFTAPTDFSYLDLTIEMEETDCDTGLGGLTAVVSNGVAPYTYAWADESGQSLGTNPDISDISPGLYSVTVTDAAGCTMTSDATLDRGLLEIDVQTSYALTCEQSVILVSIDDQNGSLTFLWTGPNGLVSNQAAVELSESGVYELLVTDSNGCEERFNIIVEQDLNAPLVEGVIACDGILRNIIGATNTFEGIIEVISPTGNVISNNGDETFTYSIFDFAPGSVFTIVATDFANGCVSQTTLEDQFLTNNSIEIISTREASCATCADGQIEASIIDPTNCVGCSIDIYTQIMGNYISVSIVNDLGQLGPGTHYVSLKDETGCVTEFLTVEL